MDWGQLWQIVSAPDNVPIVAMLFLVPFFIVARLPAGIRQRPADRAAGTGPADGQDAPPEDLAVEAPLGARSSCLAIPSQGRVSRGDNRHGGAIRLVHHAQRAARRACQPEPDDEPVEGPVVLPRPSGDARLFRPVDRGRRHAEPDDRGVDGLPLRRLEPARVRATTPGGSAKSPSARFWSASSPGSS